MRELLPNFAGRQAFAVVVTSSGPWSLIGLAWCTMLPVMLLLGPGGLEQRWANFLYAIGGQGWRYRHTWIAETVLHHGGRVLIVGLALGAAGWLVQSRLRAVWGEAQQRIAYALSCLILVSSIIGLLKQVVPAQCPWDQLGFGGAEPAVGWWQWFSLPGTARHCFPAGHAGSAFGLIGLGFAAQGSGWQRVAWCLPLGLGLLFGLDQQLRGAHFVSHDLVSLMISWTVAVALLPLLPRRRAGS